MPSPLFFKDVNNNIWVGLISAMVCTVFPDHKVKYAKYWHENMSFSAFPKLWLSKIHIVNPTPPSLLGIHGREHTDIREPAWHLLLGFGILGSWPESPSVAFVSPLGHEWPHRTLTSGTIPLKPLENDTKQERFIILSKNTQKCSHSAISQISNIPVALG